MLTIKGYDTLCNSPLALLRADAPEAPASLRPRGAGSLPVCKVAAYAFPVALSAAKPPIVLPLTALPSTSLLSPGASAGLGLALAPLGAGKA